MINNGMNAAGIDSMILVVHCLPISPGGRQYIGEIKVSNGVLIPSLEVTPFTIQF